MRQEHASFLFSPARQRKDCSHRLFLAWTRLGTESLRALTLVKKFLQSWLINTLAVLVAVYIVPGIRFEKWLDLFIASLVLGILNAILRPVLMFLALPLLIFTLGLFTLFINALMLLFVGSLLKPHFLVDNFGAAFWGALIISIVSIVLNTLTGTGASRIRFEHRRRPPNQDDNGPVIDV